MLISVISFEHLFRSFEVEASSLAVDLQGDVEKPTKREKPGKTERSENAPPLFHVKSEMSIEGYRCGKVPASRSLMPLDGDTTAFEVRSTSETLESRSFLWPSKDHGFNAFH